MLRWFAQKLKEAQEKDNKRGFTLVELLVVVIIIGILAAIAIPTFLNQRKGAWEAAAQSDLRNAATAQEGYYTDKGTYTATTGPGGLQDYGYKKSADVTLTPTVPNGGQSYCMTAVNTKGGDTFKYANTDSGPVRNGSCAQG